MKLILDTNTYVGFKLGYSEIVEYLTQADVIFVSPIVLGELIFGFRNGSRFTRNMEELNLFLSHYNGPQNLNQLLRDKTSDKARFKFTPKKEVHEKDLQWKI